MSIEEDDNFKMTYTQYLLSNFKFICTTMFDTIPQTLGLIFFNFAGEEKLSGILGFLISSFYFFFCFFFNHSEVINLKSGIHYSNKNYKQFTINIAQCILVNILFYIFSILLSFVSKPILRLLGISGEFLNMVSFFLPIYGICVGTLFMITNIIRGSVYCFCFILN